MRRAFLASVSALALAIAPVSAHGQTFSGAQSSASFSPPPPVPCPYGALFSDGCPGANQNSSFTIQGVFGQTYFAHMATSGQSWTSAHPWPFNAPGEYPVGYDTTLTLHDWTTTTPPAGCVFNATGNPFNGGPYISCTSGAPDFENWDFRTCYLGDATKCGGQIRVSGTVTKLTVKNSPFLNGSNTNFAGSYNVSSALGTNAELDLEYDEFNGGHTSCTAEASWTSTTLTVTSVDTCAANATFNTGQLVGGGNLTRTSGGTARLAAGGSLSGGAGSFTLSGNTTSGSGTVTFEMADWEGPIFWTAVGVPVTVKYIAFLNQPSADGAITGTSNTIHWDFNYTDALALNAVSVVHVATVPISTGSTLNGNITLLDYSFNVGGYSARGASSPGGGTTTYSVLGTTGKYTSVTNLKIVGNIATTNLLPGGLVSTSAALFEILDLSGITGTAEIHDNYVDPTGALSCILNVGDATFNGYWVDDGGAGPNGDSGNPGNVLHVPSGGITRGQVYVGSQIGSNSAPYGPVLAYGTAGTTGTGDAGTYAFSGPTQHVAKTSPLNGKTWDSPIATVGGSLNFGAAPTNQVGVNLTDGSAIMIVGTQWNLGACNGHH